MSEGGSALVLVVDDDDLIRKALERILQRKGHRVLLAPDGETGVRLALENDPAVIFLDLRMPGMDGQAVMKRLVEAGVDASIIVMSGLGEVADVVGALRMGIVDYLQKPWKMDDLNAALTRAIGVSQVLVETQQTGR